MSGRQIPHLWRFDRKFNAVPERRWFGPFYGSDDYRKGDPIFAPRRSSPARDRYRELRRAARASKRAAA